VLTAAALAAGMVPNFEMLLAARVVAGFAAGGVVPIAFAMVGDNVPFAQRQVAMGRILFRGHDRKISWVPRVPA